MARVYLFTGARVVGRPSINSETGEISGFSLRGSQLETIRNADGTIPCCENAGGRFELTINGRKIPARGAATIVPVNLSREAGSNADGSMYVTTKAELYEADMALSDRCDLSLTDLYENCSVDATITLMDAA